MRNKLNTLKKLSQAIAFIFPNESKETYYTPYKKLKLTPARGKLWDKYCNIRREIRNSTKQSDGITNKLDTTSQEQLAINNKELYEEDILWLKNNTAPWDIVNIKCKNTFQTRFNSLVNGVENNSYLTDYPALKSSLGFTLIELDFEEIYPGKNLVLYNKFEVFKNKLPTYVKKCNIKEVDQQVDVIQNSFELGNVVTIAALKIFVQLFKPVTVSKRTNAGSSKNSYFRPSKLEIQQSFLYYISNVSQLKEVDDAKSNRAYGIGQKLQPYMIFVETGDGQVISFYVVINKYFYKVESALKAVDICFKSFFSFHLNYTPECEQIWNFIQKYMYNIETKYDKNFQSVNSMINDLNNC
ncbi:unnamed protein product [Macrosiphum euphorbiae]|uniref:Uncharacterized protein n=1 Tax=Macrosiphum euphorbiae TaxID=13131 RepID=A0AAV0Y7A4_9HEMI|nr:unnamed protein product [Macrosiphum euphorbiae]